MSVIMWFAAVVAFVVLEAVSYQLVSIWFALGAVGGLIAKMAGASFNVQMAVFLAVSVVCLVSLRPLSKRLVKHEETKTNAESLIGQDVLITKAVDNSRETGEGKINGMTWTVRSADGTYIAENEIAVAEEIKGVKLIVKRKGE